MANTKFKFNASQYAAIKKALNNLARDVDRMAYGGDGITQQLGEDYKFDVRSAILNQTFPRAYRPLSKKYAEWKKKVHGTVPDFWSLTGSVMKNLKTKRVVKGLTLSGLMVSRQRRQEPYRAETKKTKNPYRQAWGQQTNATDYAVMVNNMRPLFGPVFEQNLNKYTRKVYNMWASNLYRVWK
jgi:hypothetical protein